MNPEINKTAPVKRPFFLTFLCIIGFTYTSLFSLLFLMGMLYSTGISGFLNKYLQIYDLSRLNFFIFSISGFLIFFTSLIGIYLMWKMQWLGFYIYAAAAVLFVSMEMIIAGFYLPDLVIHSTFILLFFISFLYGRKRNRAAKKSKLTEETKE